jgi:hypothetical protein
LKVALSAEGGRLLADQGDDVFCGLVVHSLLPGQVDLTTFFEVVDKVPQAPGREYPAQLDGRVLDQVLDGLSV